MKRDLVLQNFYIPKSWKKALTERARQKSQTVSALIREALVNSYDELDQGEAPKYCIHTEDIKNISKNTTKVDRNSQEYRDAMFLRMWSGVGKQSF